MPGAGFTQASGINDAGQIVGYFFNGFQFHGFLDIDGSFTQVDVPGAPSGGIFSGTTASGINDAGQIVGTFTNGATFRGFPSGYEGFLDTGGRFTQIDVPGAASGFPPGATFTGAFGINDAGQIVGSFTTSGHGFLAVAPAISLLKTVPINGTAASRSTKLFSFDISWVDANAGFYYLADRSNAALDVIDTTGAFTGTPDTLYGQIGGPGIGFAGDTGAPATSGPNGVTVAPNLPCIFASDTAAGGGGRVVSINYSVSFTTTCSW